jgi:DNA-binding response regulator
MESDINLNRGENPMEQEKMRAAVCEDVLEEAQWLSDMIRKWYDDKGIAGEISIFEDAAEFLFAREDYSFDVLFLDIKMPGKNGISLAKHLRRLGDDMPIIFVTGEREYILEGYEVEALHYLIKPVQEKKIFECLERVYRNAAQQEAYVILTGDMGVVKVLQKDIYYIEVFGHDMKYVTRHGEFFKTGSLKEALSELSEQDFVSCYRGIAINIRYIWRIEKDKLYMAEEPRGFEKTVPVSRRMYKQVNQKFIEYNRKQ